MVIMLAVLEMHCSNEITIRSESDSECTLLAVQKLLSLGLILDEVKNIIYTPLCGQHLVSN